MWLLIDIDNGEVIYENKDRAEVEKKKRVLYKWRFSGRRPLYNSIL